MNFLSKCTIVIPWLPCLFRMATAVSSSVELVNSVTSDSVERFNFTICAFASKCFLIELVPCSDGLRRTSWNTIHTIPGLPVSSIPMWRQSRHDDACLELFETIIWFEGTFIEAQKPSKKSCKIRSLKSRIMIHSFLEVIITSSNEVCKDFESEMAVGIRTLGNTTWEIA